MNLRCNYVAWQRLSVRCSSIGNLAWGAIALAIVAVAGCSSAAKPDPAPPAPTFTGPAFLHGTIASRARMPEYRPLLVEGFALVSDLDGTGAAEPPAYLRTWLINEMKKGGVGSYNLHTEAMTPGVLLASKRYAMVKVQGLIPPGAARGARFDLLATALPRTETTSLAGGRLMTCKLSIDGANTDLKFTDTLAEGGGELYLSPLDLDNGGDKQHELQRQAVVIGGGVVAKGQDMVLALNQPDWQLVRLMTDRINERFGRGINDKLPAAKGLNDSIIAINIPSRYADRREEFLNWVAHLYVDGSENFAAAQGQRLCDLLLANPRKYGADVIPALVALNKVVLPNVRRLYDHAVPEVRFAALEVGAALEDTQTADALVLMCANEDATIRARAAQLLINLPASIRGSDALQKLLSDPEQSVRLAAYASMAGIVSRVVRQPLLPGSGNPLLNVQALSRVVVADGERFKFALDVVRSDKPTIYIRQADVPYLVIFGPNTALKRPLVATLWDNHLMLRADAAEDLLHVFYQPPGQLEGMTSEISPAVAQLARLLGQRQSYQLPGCNLSYSQVINAIYTLYKAGYIDADIKIQESDLAKAIARSQTETPPMRPVETPAATQPGTTEPAPLDNTPTRVTEGR